LRHLTVPLTVVGHDGTIGVDFRFGLSLSTNGSRMSQIPTSFWWLTLECSMQYSGSCGSTTTKPSCFHQAGLQKPSAIEKAACIILDINLPDGSG
jgi:hypothetical protein